MANKHYVIALHPTFAPTIGGVEKGTIISAHAELDPARANVDKHNRYNHATLHKPMFGIVESHTALTKGDVHPDLADKVLADKFDADALYTMKCVLNPGWRGGRPVSDEDIGWMIERLGLPLDLLRIRYEDRAQAELDAMHVDRITLAEQTARARAVGEALATERSQFSYAFPAVAGMQAGRAYYAAQVPFSVLVKLFTFDDEEAVPAHLRAQRVLNERRAEAIGDYVVENPTAYILPAITASVSAEMSFEPVQVPGAGGRIGVLHIPMEATMLINDGQHRRRGIEQALAARPELRDETITVTIFFDQGLERSQQMFADINGKQVKPSSAINALYDRRNPFNAWVLSVIDVVPGLRARIDVENNTVPAKSAKLWSLIAFKKFLSLLTGITEANVTTIDAAKLAEIDAFVLAFFEACGEHIPGWRAMMAGDISAYEVREGLVIGHTVWLEALAMFARRALFTGYLVDHCNPEEGIIRPDLAIWERMEALAKVDARKESRMWAGRCVVLGKMQKTSDGVKGSAIRLLRLANVSLTKDQLALEKRLDA